MQLELDFVGRPGDLIGVIRSSIHGPTTEGLARVLGRSAAEVVADLERLEAAGAVVRAEVLQWWTCKSWQVWCLPGDREDFERRAVNVRAAARRLGQETPGVNSVGVPRAEGSGFSVSAGVAKKPR